jgi:hypothetical protein
MGNERSAKNNWQSVTAASIATASYLDEMEGQLLFTSSAKPNGCFCIRFFLSVREGFGGTNGYGTKWE